METTLTDSQQAVLARYGDDLLNGQTLYRKAASVASVRGDWVIVGRKPFAHALQTLGRMAAESDAMAQVAGAIVQKITRHQYTTEHEMGAAIAHAAADALRTGYDDVIGRSGPEGGRRGVKPFNLHQAVAINLWVTEAMRFCNPGSTTSIGWCLAHYAEQERVRLP
jgi:hypothetical protein